MLRMATRSGKLYLSLNDITADIHEFVLEQPKVDEMPKVLVKIWGCCLSTGMLTLLL